MTQLRNINESLSQYALKALTVFDGFLPVLLSASDWGESRTDDYENRQAFTEEAYGTDLICHGKLGLSLLIKFDHISIACSVAMCNGFQV